MPELFEQYISEVWEVMLELSPWLLFGLLLAGLMDFLIPEKNIRKWLGQQGSSSVWYAALLGVPLPLCSCGVVPAALALRRRGASRGATVSFLVTTPQSGVDSIMATWGMMGWPFALLRTGFTLLTGIVAGLSVNRFCPQEENGSTATINDTSATNEISTLKRLLKPGWDILESIYGSLIIGILLAALVSLIPSESLLSKEFCAGIGGIIVLGLIGLPLYVCATASIPLALAFHQQGFSLGAVFVFLLLGPATNMATALIVKKEIGSRAFITYLLSIAVVGLGAGLLINQIGLNLGMPHSGHHHDHGTDILYTVSAYLLTALILFLTLRKYFSKKKDLDMTDSYTVKVEGMSCEHCRKSVTRALEEVPNVSDINVNLEEGSVNLKGGELVAVKEAIIKAGFNTP